VTAPSKQRLARQANRTPPVVSVRIPGGQSQPKSWLLRQYILDLSSSAATGAAACVPRDGPTKLAQAARRDPTDWAAHRAIRSFECAGARSTLSGRSAGPWLPVGTATRVAVMTIGLSDRCAGAVRRKVVMGNPLGQAAPEHSIEAGDSIVVAALVEGILRSDEPAYCVRRRFRPPGLHRWQVARLSRGAPRMP
jgi:hypothetical protein